MAKFINLTGLATLLSQLKQKFASEAEVTQVEADTETYVLNIDYDSTLAFDTTEIIASENDDITLEENDITLEENESLLLTSSDEILVNINDEYIIVEKGE